MKMKKFCCDKFKSSYDSGKIYDNEGKLIKELYPNIVIFKITDSRIDTSKRPFRFLIVCGFLKDKPPIIMVSYCPFCGKNLHDFYKSDEYVNIDVNPFEF
jgi:hypothetical protein